MVAPAVAFPSSLVSALPPTNSPTMRPQHIELLAPARDADTALQAIAHGADAVYIGAPSHGARQAASNTLPDISRVIETAHPFGVKVYVTVNTLVLDSEMNDVVSMIWSLYRLGVDALIVQDLGLLRAPLPPIALHASTQCDLRTPGKAEMLAGLGFSQLVIARELTLDETRAIHRAVPDTPLEAFVHGALCVSFSGDCQAGQVIARRSANRGECPQICRLPYTLTDGNGRVVVRDKHLLSLRDLNRSAHLAEMIEAGIRSFKIEGRLKDANYVKNVTAHYRRLLDEIISASDGRLQRSSFGTSQITFTPDVNESFNRGFTSYFTCCQRPQNAKMASLDTAKWFGRPVATVLKAEGRKIIIKSSTSISNGDGLGFMDANGRFCGFRVNRAEGHSLFLKEPLVIAPGTLLLRNHNQRFERMLEGHTATRTMWVDAVLRPTTSGLALDLVDERGAQATAAIVGKFEQARTPQAQRHSDTLSRLGDTDFTLRNLTDRAEHLFIPASMLTALRRDAFYALESAWRASYRYDRRRPEDASVVMPEHLTYHDNIANQAAARLARDHGATDIQAALETSSAPLPSREIRVMNTRYCLRRELGYCLRTTAGKELRGPLYLTSGTTRMRVDFDCGKCCMNLFIIPSAK